MSERRRAFVLLAVLALVWGTNWPLFAYAMREVSVWTFRAITLLLAGLLLLAVARRRGQPLALPRPLWPMVAAASLCYLVVWNVASAYAVLLIPSGQAAILGFTMPLWAALIGWALLREPLGARMVAALALGGVGVGLLVWRGAEAYAQAPQGVACGLVAALGWAGGTLMMKKSRLAHAAVPATVLTGWQLLVAAVPVTAVALLRAVVAGEPLFVPGAVTVLVIGYIALVPMGLGNLLWFSIVGLLPAHVAGLGSIAVPMVALLSGAWVHGEPLGAVQWAAMACSGAALLLAMPRSVRAAANSVQHDR